MKINFIKFNKKGFTLVELMAAIFIFSVVMSSVLVIFGRSIKAYRAAKEIQRDVEEAQQTISLMVKAIRTSDVVTDCVASDCNKTLRIYNYSQDRCIEYFFNDAEDKLMMAIKGGYSLDDIADNVENCKINDFTGNYFPMTNRLVTGQFDAVPSSDTPPTVGKVTIAIEVCPPEGCASNPSARVPVQSTVSLRNY